MRAGPGQLRGCVSGLLCFGLLHLHLELKVGHREDKMRLGLFLLRTVTPSSPKANVCYCDLACVVHVASGNEGSNEFQGWLDFSAKAV